MISAAVELRAEDFVNRFDFLASYSPLYKLDGNWPSVGIVDLITHSLRGKSQLDAEDQQTLAGAACYLARVLDPLWEAAGLKVSAVLVDDILEVWFEHPEQTGARGVLPLEKAIGAFLYQPILPLPITKDYFRIIPPQNNFLSLLALGFANLASPFFSQDFPRVPAPDAWRELLAKQTAVSWKLLYPKRTYGLDYKLYDRGLFWPPLACGETPPGINHLKLAYQYFSDQKYSSEQLLDAAQFMAVHPDDQISLVGLMLCAGLSKRDLPTEVVLQARTKGVVMAELRSAVSQFRRELAESQAQVKGGAQRSVAGDDWFADTLFTPQDKFRFELERKLGMLPWFVIDAQDLLLRIKDLQLLVTALAYLDLDTALQEADRILEATPGDLLIAVQKNVLLMIQGKFDDAQANFETLATEVGAEEDALVQEQRGLCALARGDQALALSCLTRASVLAATKSRESLSRIGNNYAWALMLANDYEAALKILDDIISIDQYPVTALLNKLFILRVLGKDEAAKPLELALAKFAPLDRRVVEQLIVGQRAAQES
ncbi:hypothetical protein JNK13_05465 [bacterium]|nr:hypothetical protein [bacterium]